MQKKEASTDVELFGKHYESLKLYALKICTKQNRKHLHKDLLHESIHEYLSHKEKHKIRNPIEWIQSVMYRSIHLPGTQFFIKYIQPSTTHQSITDNEDYVHKPDEYTQIYRTVSKHLDANFDFVERTLMQLRLKGMSNKEISEMLEINYETVCRINRQTQDRLKGQVNIES